MDEKHVCFNCGQEIRYDEPEPVVIVDEIYLIRLQNEIRLMKETLTKIYNADDVFCLSDAQYEAGLTLDKITGL